MSGQNAEFADPYGEHNASLKDAASVRASRDGERIQEWFSPVAVQLWAPLGHAQRKPVRSG